MIVNLIDFIDRWKEYSFFLYSTISFLLGTFEEIALPAFS